MKLVTMIVGAGCLLVAGTAGAYADIAGLSGYGTLQGGAVVCNSHSSLDAYEALDAPNPEKLKSLGCATNGTARPAHCLICHADDHFVFISIELPKSVAKVWANKRDLQGFGWF